MKKLIMFLVVSGVLSLAGFFYLNPYQSMQMAKYENELRKYTNQAELDKIPYEDGNVFDDINIFFYRIYKAQNRSMLLNQHLKDANEFCYARVNKDGFFQGGYIPEKGKVFNVPYVLKKINGPFFDEKEDAKKWIALFDKNAISYVAPDLIYKVPSDLFVSKTAYVFKDGRYKMMPAEHMLGIFHASTEREEAQKMLFKYITLSIWLKYYAAGSLFAVVALTLYNKRKS